ncbi:MAG: DUF1553 domain-containing protein [Candidatus Hydrogenedens sp.]|nr:DUF1553 domain-containing protein [Candidatus Hydrogenedens sp.]
MKLIDVGEKANSWAVPKEFTLSGNFNHGDWIRLSGLLYKELGRGCSKMLAFKQLIRELPRPKHFARWKHAAFVVAVAAIGSATAHADEVAFTPEQVDYFETNVRPVLAEHCVQCHGAEKTKGGLRLDARQLILDGGESGPAIVPENPDGSRLVQAVRYNGSLTMPPDAKLPDAAINALTEWVRMGAPWPAGDTAAVASKHASPEELLERARAEHWAFRPVVDPVVPEHAGNNEIDAFVLARLSEAGLALSPEESKEGLLRRLYYDLIGLPPTIEELAAFEADTAPDAYAKQVETLLNSPRFGERWGRYWLDVARYADTRGYVFQQERDFAFSHTYRDYVIRAFNEDQPYDKFLSYQLAADKMELEDQHNLAAMGLLTLGRSFVGNVHDQIDDRIDVVSRGMLGLTVSCARCHDHKYDPIPAQDYYSMYGIFRSSTEPGELPLLEEPNPEDPEYQDFLAEVGKKQSEADKLMIEVQSGLLNGAREHAADYLLAGTELRGVTDTERVRTIAKERALVWQILEKWRDFLAAREAEEGIDALFEPMHQLATLPDEGFTEAAAAWHAGWFADEANRKALNPLVVEALASPPAGKADLVAAYKGILDRADKAWQEQLSALNQIANADGDVPGLPEQLPDANLDAFRALLYDKSSPSNVPRGNVDNYSDVPTQGRLRGARNAVDRVKNTHPGRPDRAMVVQDTGKPFDSYVFLRGKPENRGPDAPRRIPAILAAGERQAFEDSGRLGLAQAIASPDNPLTARVMVNRVWMNLFGQGLVSTPSDFGLRSDPPTHPELLDHLAYRFANDGWSVKQLIRLIVTSETYRQSSDWNEAGAAADPTNRLLWHQNRRRLDFEAMRDSLLAASQELDLTMGGPSVEIATQPFSTRRTVYGRIERQNLPPVFRTFDFASPDTHAPQRFNTTVPQQALYMMNSPFVVDRARKLAALEPVKLAASREAEIVQLYRHALQRDPDETELRLSAEYLDADAAIPSPAPIWYYGYGTVNPDTGAVGTFEPFPKFTEGRYTGNDGTVPDAALGWVTLASGGGHPGNDAEHAAVVRWVAPESGELRIVGKLSHHGEQGDGVTGSLALAGEEPYWHDVAFQDDARFRKRGAAVKRGDSIDLAISCGPGGPGFDSFGLTYKIILEKADGTEAVFEYAKDFGRPAPMPIGPVERLAQTLLMSNEFMFVD